MTVERETGAGRLFARSGIPSARAVLLLLPCLIGLSSSSDRALAQDEHAKPANEKSAARSRSVLDGVYSKEQSRRGQASYQEECARCHGEALGGGEGSPALVGDAFLSNWKGSTVGDLFERIRSSMPSDSPGRLSRQQYTDILAYILSANNFPAGNVELERDTAQLREIKIETK